MSKTIDAKREEKAKEFIAKAKTEFKKFIPRDKIDDVSVTTCVEKDGAFEITGAVGTVSPTGKLKTFGYTAVVKADEKGACALEKLQVNEL